MKEIIQSIYFKYNVNILDSNSKKKLEKSTNIKKQQTYKEPMDL